MSPLLLARFPEMDGVHIGFCEARFSDVALHLSDMHDLTLSEAEEALEDWLLTENLPSSQSIRAA